MSKNIQFACDCSASHYSECPPSNNLVMTPDGETQLKGTRLTITPDPSRPVANQAAEACQNYCTDSCNTLKTSVDRIGYSKRAIFDALGWDINGVAPYERWAMVGPTIVPQESSIAYTLMAILFIIFAIWAAVHSIASYSGKGSLGNVMRVINAIVAGYFGPIYLAIASIAGHPEAANSSSPAYSKVLGGLAFLVVLLLVLMFTDVIQVSPAATVYCPPGFEPNADGTECDKKKI